MFFYDLSPLSRACACARTSESLYFLLSQPSQKSLQSTVIEWVIALFSQFLRVESFFAWRASLIYFVKICPKYMRICMFVRGLQEICEGCESKKSKIAVHARVCARGDYLYRKLNDMEGMFSSENKNSPTGGGGVG